MNVRMIYIWYEPINLVLKTKNLFVINIIHFNWYVDSTIAEKHCISSVPNCNIRGKGRGSNWIFKMLAVQYGETISCGQKCNTR